MEFCQILAEAKDCKCGWGKDRFVAYKAIRARYALSKIHEWPVKGLIDSMSAGSSKDDNRAQKPCSYCPYGTIPNKLDYDEHLPDNSWLSGGALRCVLTA
jgi:hypothetical protein